MCPKKVIADRVDVVWTCAAAKVLVRYLSKRIHGCLPSGAVRSFSKVLEDGPEQQSAASSPWGCRLATPQDLRKRVTLQAV
jgi:hypothetical protein